MPNMIVELSQGLWGLVTSITVVVFGYLLRRVFACDREISSMKAILEAQEDKLDRLEDTTSSLIRNNERLAILETTAVFTREAVERIETAIGKLTESHSQ